LTSLVEANDDEGQGKKREDSEEVTCEVHDEIDI